MAENSGEDDFTELRNFAETVNETLLEQFLVNKVRLRSVAERGIQFHERDKDFTCELISALDRAVEMLDPHTSSPEDAHAMRLYVYLGVKRAG